MKLFSITDDDVVLYDTRFGRVELHRFDTGAALAGAANPPIETVLCVVEGQLDLQVDGNLLPVGTMAGMQIPPARRGRPRLAALAQSCCVWTVPTPLLRQSGP